MKREKRIVVIGNFGYKTNQLDGQTVKTRSILEFLRKMNFQDLTVVDTSFKFNITKIFQLIISQHLIIYVGAANSFKYLLPFIWSLSKIKKSQIHYIHVGSFLVQFLKKNATYRFFIKNATANYCETFGMIKELTNFSIFHNLHYLPNFRITNFKPKFRETKTPLKLVYFGRILKEKGINLLFDAHEILRSEFEAGLITIDYYGQIVDEGIDFKNKVKESNGLRYNGYLDPDSVQKTLTNYDALVFPTYFHEEGFPGAILDAFLSGIPVIASDWLYNSELVEHRKTGLLFKVMDSQELASSLNQLIISPSLLDDLRKRAIEKGRELYYELSTEILRKQLL